jgi:type II secretory pathway pseudopilin PulG
VTGRAAPLRQPDGDGGFTLIELMVGLLTVSILTAGIFRVYADSSIGLRTQAKISELQQTLRAARQALIYDARMAGFFASDISSGVALSPLKITNNNNAPDSLLIAYADTSCSAQVEPGPGPPFNSAETNVTSVSCFQDGDVAVAVRTKDVPGVPRGTSCTLKITGVQPGPKKIQHNPGQGAPFNTPGNAQCDALHPAANPGAWKDGYTYFMRFQARAYRIKPNDDRGVLQMSPSGGASNDWQDLAFGIVDMQFAVRQYQPGDAVDADGDGDPQRDWLSGENMEADQFAGNNVPIQLRITLLGRTLMPVQGASGTQTYAITGSPVNNNMLGDRPAISLPVPQNSVWPLSMYKGDFVFRYTTTIVDLRNVGIGQ